MYELVIMAALLAWTRGSVPQATLQTWADAMGDVCASERECVELAAIAWEESRFAPWVLDGSCNSQEWRRAHGKDRVCDGGLAFGAWQLHDARAASASPALQASVALVLMRRYPQAWTTWPGASRLAAGWLAGVASRRP